MGLDGQTVTFHEDVAPILYGNCTECHREGEIGPMPFTTYAEVAPYGEFIEYVTSIGYMPPWTPDPEYSHFVGEKVLTSEELTTLSASGSRQAGRRSGRQSRSPPISLRAARLESRTTSSPCRSPMSTAAT